MHWQRWLICGCASLLAACGGTLASDGPGSEVTPDSMPASPGAAAPLRVLVLSGGGYHEFGANLDVLLPALAARLPLLITRLRLGPDAPGAQAPEAQAARALLTGPALRESCDVVLAYTQGELGLLPAEQAVLLEFVRGGGGFVGLHCAVDSHPGWDEYVQLCGGRFDSHPPFGDVHVRVEATIGATSGAAPAAASAATPGAAVHPVVAGLPAAWDLRDEFYHLTDWNPEGATLLMSGVSPAAGERRPVAWCRASGDGRVVCMILGHGAETHGDARYQQFVAQALVWAAAR